MAAAAQITIQQFLNRHEKPECELINGALVAKPMGTLDHMNMERRLMRLLEAFEARGLGHVLAELSVRHGEQVRIPDVVFYPSTAEFAEGLLVSAPLLCVEVLSPSQSVSELFAKCETYHEWAVPFCWVIDPIAKAAWEYHLGQTVISVDRQLTAGTLSVSLVDLFG